MEAAIHGMNLAFQDKGSDAVFLVDAINASTESTGSSS